MKYFKLLSFLLVVLTFAGCADDSCHKASSGEVQVSTITPYLDESAARLIAQNRFKKMSEATLENSGWESHYTLGKAYPIYAPGIEEPAYYEFKVLNGTKDAGYIMVSTTKTDVLVPEATMAGATLTERYTEATSRNDLTIVRYNWVQSAAYDKSCYSDISAKEASGASTRSFNANKVIASMGFNTPGLTVHDSDGDTEISAQLFDQHSNQAQMIAETKAVPSFTPNALENYYKRLSDRQSGDSREQITTRGPLPYVIKESASLRNRFPDGQHTPSWCQPSHKTTYDHLGVEKKYYVGCGPTAWAIVYGYWHQHKGKRALFGGRSLDEKYNYWASFKGYYDNLIFNAFCELNGLCKTIPVYTGNNTYSGLTWPADMAGGLLYAINRGYSGAYKIYFPIDGFGRVFDDINNDYPAILEFTIRNSDQVNSGGQVHYGVIEEVYRENWSNWNQNYPFELSFLVNYGWADVRKWIYYCYDDISTQKWSQHRFVWEIYVPGIGDIAATNEIENIVVNGSEWDNIFNIDIVDSFGDKIAAAGGVDNPDIKSKSLNNWYYLDSTIKLDRPIRKGDYFCISGNYNSSPYFNYIKKLNMTFYDKNFNERANNSIQTIQSGIVKLVDPDSGPQPDNFFRFYYDGYKVTYAPTVAGWKSLVNQPEPHSLTTAYGAAVLAGDIGAENRLFQVYGTQESNGTIVHARKEGDSDWDYMGGPFFSLDSRQTTINCIDIAIGPDEHPVVCYDANGGMLITTAYFQVKKWNGSSWDTLPAIQPAISDEDRRVITDIGGDNLPVVAVYGKGSDSIVKFFVYKWDGSAWKTIFSKTLPSSTIKCMDISVTEDNRVYVAYGAEGYVFVEQWDGGQWQQIYTGPGDVVSIDAISGPLASVKPVLASWTATNGNISVRQYNDITWETCLIAPATGHINTGLNTNNRFEVKVAPDGSCYLAYLNSMDNNYPYIMSYKNGYSSNLLVNTITGHAITLDMNNNGNPVVSFLQDAPDSTFKVSTAVQY